MKDESASSHKVKKSSLERVYRYFPLCFTLSTETQNIGSIQVQYFVNLGCVELTERKSFDVKAI